LPNTYALPGWSRDHNKFAFPIESGRPRIKSRQGSTGPSQVPIKSALLDIE